MTYLDTDTSPHDGAPIELYKFEGTYENYYYTSAARKIAYLGHDYLPIPLQRTEIAAGTQNDDGLNITIDLPVTAGLVAIYGFEDSPPELNLTIYRYHDIGAVVVYWIGPVASITTNDGIATVQSNSELATLLASDFPNVYYQGPCNFTLFDIRCKVIEANYSGTAVLSVVNGRAVSVDTIPLGATGINLDGKLVGGEVLLPSGERRMIVGQAGVVITLNFPFSRTTLGDVVTITAGCDHAYEGDCKLKFDNQTNYGGFPFIGADNPFTAGIQDGSKLPDNTCLPPVFDGTYTLAVYTGQPNPCNPNWDGISEVVIENIQPNGPHGKTIGFISFPSGSAPTVIETYEYNNPTLDPRLQGQLLVRVVVEDWNTKYIEYHFPGAVFVSGYVKPSARYCGSVGKSEGTYSLTVAEFGGFTTIYGPKPAGGNYDIYFP